MRGERRRRVIGAVLGGMPAVERVELTNDVDRWSCARITSTSFDLDGEHYPSGSWLVRLRGRTYATAMTDDWFRRWRDGLKEATP